MEHIKLHLLFDFSNLWCLGTRVTLLLVLHKSLFYAGPYMLVILSGCLNYFVCFFYERYK
jgi:hypothetical protein